MILSTESSSPILRPEMSKLDSEIRGSRLATETWTKTIFSVIESSLSHGDGYVGR